MVTNYMMKVTKNGRIKGVMLLNPFHSDFEGLGVGVRNRLAQGEKVMVNPTTCLEYVQ